MSAKNYKRCPRCIRRAEAERQARLAAAERAYWTVPPARFLRLNEEASKSAPLRDTLREDYEVGVDERGMFHLRYSCDCGVCGFGYVYTHKTRAEPGKD